ncbi:hypothetical protein BC826DRAFT_1082483, partial [Russula brevipes]
PCSSSCSLACFNCASEEWACFLWDGSCGNRSGYRFGYVLPPPRGPYQWYISA